MCKGGVLRRRSSRVTDEDTWVAGERKSERESARNVQEVVQHCRREGRRIWATITRRPTLRLSFLRAPGAAITYTLSRFRNNNYLISEANGEMRDSCERRKESARKKKRERERKGPVFFRSTSWQLPRVESTVAQKSTKTIPVIFERAWNRARTKSITTVIDRSFDSTYAEIAQVMCSASNW